MSGRIQSLLGLLALWAGTASPGSATCYGFPCTDCTLRSLGQLSIVEIDDDAGIIHLTPNVRLAGTGESLALVVPTPSTPTLEPVEREIWDDMFALTAPVRRTNGFDSGGCGRTTSIQPASPLEDYESGGIGVIRTETVGAFEATILTAATFDDLAGWLTGRGFVVTAEDRAILEPLVIDGWTFTAMTLAPGTSLPPSGWDRSVDPVRFTFEADHFETTAAILNASAGFGSFFVIAGNRMTMSGYSTRYANRINARERRAIAETYPRLAAVVREGMFVTRLDSAQPVPATPERYALTQTANEELAPVLWSGVEFLTLFFVTGMWSARARRRKLA